MSESATVKLNISKAVTDSLDLYKENIVLLIVSGVLASLVSSCSFGLLSGAMFIGMFMMSDRLITRDETKPVFGDLFKGLSHFIPGLVLVIFGALGVIVCGIGIFITMPVALLGMLRVADKGVSIGEAISFGFDVIFKQKQWMFIVLMVVAGILSSLGSVLCGVGVLATFPLYYLVLANGYRQLCPKA